jgi:hypothetical protein
MGMIGAELGCFADTEKVTTRSRRRAIVRESLGSLVDYVLERADCPVIEA